MICSKCHIDKDETEFNFKSIASGERRRDCKVCVKEWRKGYYKQNRTTLIQKSTSYYRPILVRNQKFVLDYLLKHSCVTCGESDPVVLEFDHRDRDQKVMEIGAAITSGWSLERIKEEIDKCDVLCANCHKRKTAKEFKWYKYLNTLEINREPNA